MTWGPSRFSSCTASLAMRTCGSGCAGRCAGPGVAHCWRATKPVWPPAVSDASSVPFPHTNATTMRPPSPHLPRVRDLRLAELAALLACSPRSLPNTPPPPWRPSHGPRAVRTSCMCVISASLSSRPLLVAAAMRNSPTSGVNSCVRRGRGGGHDGAGRGPAGSGHASSAVKKPSRVAPRRLSAAALVRLTAHLPADRISAAAPEHL